jgi:hypothetical protein
MPVPGLEEHPGLGGGMIVDQQRHTIKGAFRDARDVLVDVADLVRKRGGTRNVMPAPQSMFPQHIAAYSSSDVDGLKALYAASGTTPAQSSFIAAAAVGGGFRSHALTAGRRIGIPFRYGSALCFPQLQVGSIVPPLIMVAGSTFRRTSSTETLTSASISTVAGSAEVAIPVADAVKCDPGRIVVFGDTAATPDKVYVGRIVRRNAAGNRIWVDPPVPFGVVGLTSSSASDYLNETSSFFGGCMTGCSWQNRVIVGGVVTYVIGQSGSAALVPERMMWSILPTESALYPVTGAEEYLGLVQAMGQGFDADNFTDFPSLGSIVAFAPIGEELLLFGPERVERIVGNLSTIEGTAELVSDHDPLTTSVGCLAESTVRETPRGVVWAGQEGVFIYSGGPPKRLMDGIASYWHELQARDGFEIYGSALIGDEHYLLSTSDATLLLHLHTGGWVRVRDDLTVSSSMADPLDPSRVYASTWTDPAGGAPDAASTQVFRIDTLHEPRPENAIDHDGTIVEPYLETRAFPFGGGARLKETRRISGTVDLKGTDTTEGTITGLQSESVEPLELPNTGAEFGTTDGWLSSNATVTADSTTKRTGSYAIKAVTTAINGGVTYHAPGGYADSRTTMCCEVWAYITTAGTLTVTFGGDSLTATTTGEWLQFLLFDNPANGELTNLAVTITHSANAATFYVDDLDVTVLQPWEVFSDKTNIVTGAEAFRDSLNEWSTGKAGIKVVTPATSQTGIAYKQRGGGGLTIRKNEQATAHIWVRNDEANPTQTYTLLFGGVRLGDGTFADYGQVTISPGVEWQRYSVDFIPDDDDVDELAISVRVPTAVAKTFYVGGPRITLPDPEVAVAVIGGLGAEGDFGDGVALDTRFLTFDDDYEALTSPTLVAANEAGYVEPLAAAADVAVVYRGDDLLSTYGEVIVEYQRNHASDTVAALLSCYSADTHLFADVNSGGVASIRKKVGGGAYVTLANETMPTLTLGVTYWIRFVRRGSRLTLEHWTEDPALGGDVDPLVEHVLEEADAALFADPGRFGFRFLSGDTSLRILGFRCEPYDSLAIVTPDDSSPHGFMGSPRVITRAATLIYRQIGASAECGFGPVEFEYDLLRPGRRD